MDHNKCEEDVFSKFKHQILELKVKILPLTYISMEAEVKKLGKE